MKADDRVSLSMSSPAPARPLDFQKENLPKREIKFEHKFTQIAKAFEILLY